jgi:hypothetical protein
MNKLVSLAEKLSDTHSLSVDEYLMTSLYPVSKGQILKFCANETKFKVSFVFSPMFSPFEETSHELIMYIIENKTSMTFFIIIYVIQ